MQVTACHSITNDDGCCTEWSVNIDLEQTYQPDLLDDATSRVRDLFRLVISDSLHLSIEHDE